MPLPRGLRKPRRIALLIPIGVAMIGASAVVYFGLQHMARIGFLESPKMGETGAATAGYAPSIFQPEVFFGLGAAALLVALAWAVWRTRSGRD